MYTLKTAQEFYTYCADTTGRPQVDIARDFGNGKTEELKTELEALAEKAISAYYDGKEKPDTIVKIYSCLNYLSPCPEYLIKGLLYDNEGNNKEDAKTDTYEKGYYEGCHDAYLDVLNNLNIPTTEEYLN